MTEWTVSETQPVVQKFIWIGRYVETKLNIRNPETFRSTSVDLIFNCIRTLADLDFIGLDLPEYFLLASGVLVQQARYPSLSHVPVAHHPPN